MISLCKKLVIFALLVAAAAGLTACGSEKAPQEGENSLEAQAVLVDAAPVEKGDIASISTVNGKIAANIEVSIVPKMPGKVAEVLFDVGDRVHKGDVLVRLEAGELRAQLKQAEAGLEKARASFADAKKNFERMQSLYEQGAVSQQQLEAAQTQLTMGNPDSAEAAVELIRTQLENTVIVSPVDGIVAARNVEIGEMAGQVPVMTIVDIDQVTVETTVTEAEVNKLNAGQTVDVVVSAVQAQPFKGVIASISPAADARSSAFPVKVKIPNPEHRLKPGMFAEVKLALEIRKEAVIIPKEALVGTGENQSVFIVKDNKALQKKVTTGISDDTRVEVVSGISAGEMVVTKGQLKLQDQTPVMVDGR